MFDSNDIGPVLTAARRDSALSPKQLALLASTTVSHIIDLEHGKIDNITAEQFLSALHHVGLDIKIIHIVGPRPTYDDLVAHNCEKSRSELFSSWLNAEPGP